MKKIEYDSDDFHRLIDETGAAVSKGDGRCLILAGGCQKRRREVLNAIGDRTTLNVHQRDAETAVVEM